MEVVRSPLNYTGGKARLWPQILPHLPPHVRVWVDAFAGGGTTVANAPANTVRANDVQPDVLELLRVLATHPAHAIEAAVDRIVAEYGLSDSSRHGYAHYGAHSSGGLARANKEGHARLRAAYNTLRAQPSDPFERAVLFFALLVFSFNNQLRFNASGSFNVPVGKRDFNAAMRRSLAGFCGALAQRSPTFTTGSYADIPLDGLDGRDFIYADPPYLITLASYNEANGWNAQDDHALMAWLDQATERAIPFAMSNVLTHKGRHNAPLEAWARERHHVVPLRASYANATYARQGGADRPRGSQEVLILNTPALDKKRPTP